MGLGVGDQIGTSLELPLAPGCDHGELGRERGVGELETDLVVALAGGAMRHGVGALPAGDVDLTLGDERARDRGAEQVLVLVDRARPQHREDVVADEFFAEILEHELRGAGPASLLLEAAELLSLSEVGTERHHFGLVPLDEPAEDDGGVEPARVGEDDAAHGRLDHGRSTYHRVRGEPTSDAQESSPMRRHEWKGSGAG